MANRRFGWHSGSVSCYDMTVNNDLTIEGDMTFGDASTDTLTVTGKLDCNGDVDLGSGDDTINVGSGSGDTVNVKEDAIVADDKKLYLGSDSDWGIEYDEDGNDVASITGADMRVEGNSGAQQLQFRDSALYIASSADGQLDIVADTTVAISGAVTVDSSLSIADDQNLVFGNDSDVTMAYDETTDDRFEISSKQSAVIVSGRVDKTTGYETMFLLSGTLDSDGSAGGVKTRGLMIDLERTTETVGNGDSRDTALNVYIIDSVGNHTAGYFIRAMDVKAEFDSAGTTLTNMYAAQFTAEVDNGTATDYMCVTFNSKVDGTVTNDAINVRIYDESQGTVSGDHIGLQFATKNVAPASGQRDHVIEVTQADSTGWLNFAHFTNAADGYTCVDTDAACSTTTANSDAAIRIDIAGTAYYVPAYTASNTTNSW